MVKTTMEGETHHKKRSFDRIENPKLRRVTYVKRKECVKKKTMELGVLCGIEVCTVILGPNGEVDTWPENPTEVKSMIGKYRDHAKDRRSKKPVKRCEFLGEKSNRNRFLLGWDDDWLNGLPVQDLASFLRDLESKLQAMENRIDLLNSLNSDFLNSKESDGEEGNGIDCLTDCRPQQQTINPTAFGYLSLPRRVQPLNGYGFSDQNKENWNDYGQQSFPMAKHHLQPLPLNGAVQESGYGFGEKTFNSYGGSTDRIEEFEQFVPKAEHHLQSLPLNGALLESGYGFGEKTFSSYGGSTNRIEEFDGNYRINEFALQFVPKSEHHLQPLPLNGALVDFRYGFGENPVNSYGGCTHQIEEFGGNYSRTNDFSQQFVPEHHLQPLPLNEALLKSGYGFGEKPLNYYGGSTNQIDEFDGNYCKRNDFAQQFAPNPEIFVQHSPLYEAPLGSVVYGNSQEFVEPPGFGEGASF